MRAKITLTSVAALKAGQTIYDTELKGFLVRCQGKLKVYSVRKKHKGRNLQVRIGEHGNGWTPDTARKRAQELLRELGVGNDPRITSIGSVTLAEAAERFLEHIETKRQSGTHREYKGHLNDHLLPRFGKRALENITVGELRRMHQEMSGRPTLANRIMDTLSSLYGWQQGNDPNKPLFNPAARTLVERYPEKDREFRLTHDQALRLGEALRAFEAEGNWSPFALAAIWLYLATGQRRDSIRTMRWEHVDWNNRKVTMHVKRRGMVPVQFNDAAMAILRKLRAYPDDGNPYVIRGSKPGQPYKNMQDVWNAVRTRAKLDAMRIHDFRHHVGSTIGDSYHVATVAKVLGNTKAAAMRYVHADDSAAERASEQVGNALTGLMQD